MKLVYCIPAQPACHHGKEQSLLDFYKVLSIIICLSQYMQNKNQASSRDDTASVMERDDMNNARFSAYYKAQKIVPEEEWDVFLDSLRQHLPTTFRVAGSRQ